MTLARDAYSRYSDVVHTSQQEDGGHLRAGDGMNYREFLAVLKHLWELAHPDVPMKPTQTPGFATYPVIVHSLELRKAHPSEPKKRFRENITSSSGDIYSIWGQRFQNLVMFSAVTRSDPELASEIIEEFQSFMEEHTGTLKELGVSEIVFSRRMPDNSRKRSSEDIAEKSIAYLVTIETVSYVQESKLESILIEARTYLDSERIPSFEVTQNQVGTNKFNILKTNIILAEGDQVVFGTLDVTRYVFPSSLSTHMKYVIRNIAKNNSATPYFLTAALYNADGITPIIFANAGKGVMRHTLADNITTELLDQYEGATPSI